tara:strand:+ start:11114 stop:15331 length:4218 start_codon:yes stop_codon:yes gene_type:complete
VNVPFTQKKMAQYLDVLVMAKSDLIVSSKKLKISIIGGFHWYDVLLLDANYDTVAYIPEVHFKPSFTKFKNLKSIDLKSPVYYLRSEGVGFSLSNFNFDLSSSFLTFFSEAILIHKISVHDGELLLVNEGETKSFRSIEIIADNIRLGHQYNFFLRSLSWVNCENKKQLIKSTFFELKKDSFFASEFQWEYMNSSIHLDLFMERDSSVFKIKNLVFNARDMQDFILSWPSHSLINLSSDIYFKGDSIFVDKIVLNTQNNTFFSGFLSLNNWRNPSDQYGHIVCDSLYIAAKEWEWIETCFQSSHEWSSLGGIQSSFIAKGTFSDFDIDLSLHSNIGDLKSSLNFTGFDSKTIPEYNGSLILSDFNLGSLFRSVDVKSLTGKFYLNGKGFRSSSFLSDINASISMLEFRDYRYRDILFNGRLEPNFFKGKSEIRDDNLQVDFFGEIDFSKALPKMDFTADIFQANLVKLNFPVRDSIAKLSGLLEMNFEGSDWSSFQGTVGAYYTNLQTRKKDYHFDEIFFNSQIFGNQKQLSFVSNFMNINIQGEIDIPHLFSSVETCLAPHFPIFNSYKSVDQNFSFNIDLYNSSVVKEFMSSDFDVADGSFFSGNFNRNEGVLDINFEMPNLRWKEWFWTDVKLNSLVTSKYWDLNCQGSNFYFEDKLLAENIEYDQVGSFGDLRNSLAWYSSDSLKSNGMLKAHTRINDRQLNLQFEPSYFYFSDSLWSIQDISSVKFEMDDFQAQVIMNTMEQDIEFNWQGNSENYFSSVLLNNLNLSGFSPWYLASNSIIDGEISGFFEVQHQFGEDKFHSQLQTDSIHLNNELFGVIELDLDYDKLREKHTLSGDVQSNGEVNISFEGLYPLNKDSNLIDLDLEVFDFNMAHINQYLPFIDNMKGRGIGFFHFYGPLSHPKFDGDFIVDNLGLSVPFLNADFSALGYSSCRLSDEEIEFKEIDFYAIDNKNFIGEGLFDGVISHSYFTDFGLDINLGLDSVLALNSNISSEEGYYGRAIATGDIAISGFTGDIQIGIDAIFEKGSTLFIPLDNGEDLEDLTCVHFIQKDDNQKKSSTVDSSFEEPNSGVSIDMNLELNEDTEIHIIFDETLGDKLTTNGAGFINLGVNKANEVFMFGDYILSGGEYLFTLQNFVNKKFEIEQGSKFIWEGEPSNAQMNLSALYRITPSIEPLSPGDTRNSEVECGILMTGNLLYPDIEFDIQIPNADDEVRRVLADQINTEERRTQQFLSLLVLNCFMSSQDIESTDIDYLSSTVSTGAEVLNNQLFNWSSQFSERFDLGFKYYPNLDNSINNKEFELLLTNMKVNDRITFNGNIGTQAGQNTTKIIGDFKVEYQISKDRKLRMIAFRSLEESPLLDSYENSYTKGLGLFYRDEFEDARDLWTKFKLIFKSKNRIRESS